MEEGPAKRFLPVRVVWCWSGGEKGKGGRRSPRKDVNSWACVCPCVVLKGREGGSGGGRGQGTVEKAHMLPPPTLSATSTLAQSL